MNRKILVTGGAGFIGSNLVNRLLLESGTEVTVVDNFHEFYPVEIKKRNVSRFEDQVSIVNADIRDRDGMRRVFQQGHFDVVVHLAARAGIRPSLKAPFEYADTNVNGTLNLLECSREFAVRKFVFGSSSSVYGSRDNAPFLETDEITKPISPYAATKVAGEAMCHTYSHLYGLKLVCLRFFTVYGPAQRPDLAIQKFTNLISAGREIPVFGDGTTKRDYTYVDDVVEGIVKSFEYEGEDFDIFNIGDSRTVELIQLIRLIEKNLGIKASIDYGPQEPGDVPMTCADISKASRILGYEPATRIEDGIARFIEWHRNQ